jgi:hypothetical protein
MQACEIYFWSRPEAVFGLIYMGHDSGIGTSNIVARSRNIIIDFMIIARSSNIIAPKQHCCFWSNYYCADIDCCFAILRQRATLLLIRNIRAQLSNIIAFTGLKNDPSLVYGAKITPIRFTRQKPPVRFTRQFSERRAPLRIPWTKKPNRKSIPHHRTDPILLWRHCPTGSLDR